MTGILEEGEGHLIKDDMPGDDDPVGKTGQDSNSPCDEGSVQGRHTMRREDRVYGEWWWRGWGSSTPKDMKVLIRG